MIDLADIEGGMTNHLIAAARCDEARDKIARILEDAKVDDAGDVTAEDHVLLIEEHSSDGSMYITAHVSAADAVACSDDSSESGYEIGWIIDLDTGEVYSESAVREEMRTDQTTLISSAIWAALDQFAGDSGQLLDIVNHAIDTWSPKP